MVVVVVCRRGRSEGRVVVVVGVVLMVLSPEPSFTVKRIKISDPCITLGIAEATGREWRGGAMST